jgi:hypothetical protein
LRWIGWRHARVTVCWKLAAATAWPPRRLACRSATAVAAACARNAAAIQQGRIDVRRSTLAELPPPQRHFDLAFAINVNLFWRGGAAELAVLRRQLASRGRLLLVWEPPAARQVVTIRDAATALLSDGSFVVEDTACDTTGRLPLLALDCRLSGR